MPARLTLSIGTLYAFLLVLARVGGAFIFVPLPAIRSAPETARAVLVFGITLALMARWPVVEPAAISAARLAGWAASEAAVGIAIGVAVSIVLEIFTLAGQIAGLQAGYAYASTIDPNTQADSGILLVFAELVAGLLFFALGLDRDVVRLFAISLDKIPPGNYILTAASAQAFIHLGANLFSVGLRLAFPVVALLVMVDVAFALLGRVNAQLQLLSLAFPAKMLLGLLVLSWTAFLFPRMLREIGQLASATTRQALGL
jgi:flagellar biosynthetic protein FliR